MINHSEYRLTQEIIGLSVASVWHEAKLEWDIDHIQRVEMNDARVCLCGHTPILELCHIKNRLNGRIEIVGNVCVTKFMGINAGAIFACLKRIAKDIDLSQNIETISYGKEQGWYSKWDYDFLIDTFRCRALSPKQSKHRVRLNQVALDKSDFQKSPAPV